MTAEQAAQLFTLATDYGAAARATTKALYDPHDRADLRELSNAETECFEKFVAAVIGLVDPDDLATAVLGRQTRPS